MSVSKKGYSDKSPYKNRKSLLINSPQGLIDMNNTGRFLMGIDETGFSKLLLPYSGLHQFPGKKITELPLAQQGGPTPVVPLNQDYMNDRYKDYTNFYSKFNIPPREYSNDDGFDAYYHHTVDNLPKIKTKVSGWNVVQPGLNYFQQETDKNNLPNISKKAKATWTDNHEDEYDNPNKTLNYNIADSLLSYYNSVKNPLHGFSKFYQQGGTLPKAQQGKLFPDFTSNYDFGPVNPNSQLKQSNIPIGTTSPKVDPYVNIINKDTKARQAEYRKDLGKRALMSAGASAAIVTGGAALPFLSPALATPIAGIQGLTTGNLINAGFAYQAAKNIPNVVSSVKTAYNDPTLNNITNATAQTALTALDAFPFAHGIAGEVKNKVLKGAKKVDDFFYDNVYGPSTVENIKPKNLQRELGKPIPINTGGNNLEVFNMKRFPNYLVKVEDPRRGELIFENGYKDLDLVDLMKDVKDENIGKIVKQFKISPAQQALITNRVKGAPPHMLDPIDFRKIKDQSYIDLFNRVKEVRNKGLGYDFYGDNYHYIKDNKTFGIFDINPIASDKNWKGDVQANMDLKSYSPEESARNISQALANKIKNDYSRSLDNYFLNYYEQFSLGDGTYLGTNKINKLSKSRDAFNQKIDRILNSNNLDPYKKGGILPKAQQGTINNPFSNVGKSGWEKHKLEPVKTTPVEPFVKKEETPWYENLYNTFRDKVEKAFPTGSVNLGGAGFSPEGAKKITEDITEKAISVFSNDWAERYNNHTVRDKAKENTKLVETESRLDPEKIKYDPVYATGDTIRESQAKDSRRYHLPEVIDLNYVRFGVRNRGDNRPLNTEGAPITTFNPFVSSSNYFKTVTDAPNSTYIGLSNDGKIKVGGRENFQDQEYQITKTFSNKVIDFNRDASGNIMTVPSNPKASKNTLSPSVKVMRDDGKIINGSLSLLLPKEANNNASFDIVTGGRYILQTPDGKTKLVSGSLNDIATQFNKFKQNNPYVNIITLDNGSYSRGIRTYDQKLTTKDLKAYDNQNTQGGNIAYMLPEKHKTRFDSKFSEFEGVATKNLQLEFPNRKVQVGFQNTGEYGSNGERNVSSQADIQKKGYSKTPISMHNFNAAKDYVLYVDGKPLDPEQFKHVYKKVLWNTAEKTGLYHLDDWDPTHISLAKEGEKTGINELFEKYPDLFNTPNFKNTVDFINKNKDNETYKEIYNLINNIKPFRPVNRPKFKNGGTIKDMNKLPKAQMGNLYETPDYFGVKQMLKPKKKFPVFQPDNTYLTSNKVPLNEARPENEQEVQWHPDWVEDENNPGHEIPREEKVYKNDDIKPEAPVSEELPTMENKRRFGEINYKNLQWLMPINTGLRILSNKYAEKEQDAYKKRNNVLNTQAVAPNFYGYDTVTGHDYTNNYSQFAKKGGIKKYNDGGLALLRSYIEDYIYEDDTKDTKRVTTKDVNNAEAEQKAKAERRAFFQQRRLREYQNEEDFLSSLFQQKDNNNQRSSRGEFQSFSSPEEGRKALVNQLNLYQTGRTKNNVKPNSTLLQAMSVYAPASNNNDPQGYANFIGKKLGVSVDTPIKDLDPNKWADAITIMENNKFGNNPGNLKKTRKYLKGGTYFVSEEELSDMKKQGIKFKEI